MRLMRQLFLVLALVAGPSLATAHDELGPEPGGPDSLVQTAGTPQSGPVAGKITIYTAKTVIGGKAFPAGAIK